MELLPDSPIEYCDFYKHLIVEELSLCDYPHQIHYGKCSIIGIVTRSESGLYHLNNVTVDSGEKELQLPNCCTNIIVLDTMATDKIPINKACEMFGEAVLYDTVDITANIIPKTSKDLVEELRELKSKNAGDSTLDEALKAMAKRYLPAIRVFTLCIVDQAGELIGYNLAIRCLKMQRTDS